MFLTFQIFTFTFLKTPIVPLPKKTPLSKNAAKYNAQRKYILIVDGSQNS